MPRISLPSPDTMDAAQRAVYDKIVSGPRGKIQGPLRAVLHNAELADRWQALGALLRFAPNLRLASERPSWRATFVLRGLAELPVALS